MNQMVLPEMVAFLFDCQYKNYKMYERIVKEFLKS